MKQLSYPLGWIVSLPCKHILSLAGMTTAMESWDKYHRGQKTPLSHCTKSPSTWLTMNDAGLDPLSQERFVRIVHYKVCLFSSTLFGRNQDALLILCAWTGLHRGTTIYISYLKFFYKRCISSLLSFIYSFSHLFNYLFVLNCGHFNMYFIIWIII